MNGTNSKPKQIGDQVRVTAGQHKNLVGVITAKERRGWTIEIEDGSLISVPFPMVALIDAGDTVEAVTEPIEGSSAAQSSPISAMTELPEDSISQDVISSESEPVEQADDESVSETDSQSDPADQQSGSDTLNSTEASEISKMTVKELWALAKQRGVSVARTKTDFLRIIKEKHPDEDLALLKGKALYDRVGELHISRLRTKAEMVRLLSA